MPVEFLFDGDGLYEVGFRLVIGLLVEIHASHDAECFREASAVLSIHFTVNVEKAIKEFLRGGEVALGGGAKAEPLQRLRTCHRLGPVRLVRELELALKSHLSSRKILSVQAELTKVSERSGKANLRLRKFLSDLHGFSVESFGVVEAFVGHGLRAGLHEQV